MRRLIEVDGLFDGERVVEHAAIVVEDDRIAWVGRRGHVPRSVGATTAVDAPGRFALPGLINCHAHLTLDGSADFSAATRRPVAAQTLTAFRSARAALRSGVTLVRDLGAAGTTVIELAREIERGGIEGPRILAAGRGVTTTGGHGLEIARMADGEDEVRKAVREQLMDGARCIKLFSTGGVLGEGARPEVSQFSAAETRAAVEEAHKAGVRITTHAHGAEGVRIAVQSGVDSIEHATMLDRRAVQLLNEKDVAIVPTLSALAAIMANLDSVPAHVRERAQVTAARHHESVRLAHQAGVRIAAGTDAGTPFNTHDAFAEELRLLAEVGLSREQALAAATSVAARVVGADGSGRIGPGARADLVFVDGDPTKDLAVLRSPRGVWVRGEAAPL
ncbi:MAG TPA: amidohydrolase family protein [Candidatus Limnocylindria bacterium]|nr:amidohydrolase family protein [Candidatus Limnocylindria bacterium]